MDEFDPILNKLEPSYILSVPWKNNQGSWSSGQDAHTMRPTAAQSGSEDHFGEVCEKMVHDALV
ncbi:uncharacterized protein K460DRAFT_194448 [Cucurbitaria berberidis CBS 394.84]|uniref:Uncharacterized protein n=1 Tax=Cucurbitaria berberidis CBS 394.84 TaxID=1168544 RepID=A0A9P4L3G5_9PLEO|nr:uncharacterized protein K460DRAFT_194448 [Cucurbitaria berberidis CBS 394.84]KAF1840906.1 hypothetical protein K460DRAFT_194448 [Cucurbitaria berberidis CBS 394.84]